MLLAITADLHYPKTGDLTLLRLVENLARLRPELLILAGDLGETSAYSAPCLALFRELPCPKLVLAGNHDLYPDGWPDRRLDPAGRFLPGNTRYGGSSMRLWQSELRQQLESVGGLWLEELVYVRPPVAIVGTIAWYDYSAADPSLGYPPEVYAREKHFFSTDDRINWPWSDQEFSAQVSSAFLQRLDAAVARPDVAHVAMVTHVPILEQQLARRPGDRFWSFSNAYFGNLTLGQAVLRRDKVCLVVSGHTHYFRRVAFLAPNGRVIQAAVVGRRNRQPSFLSFRVPPPALPGPNVSLTTSEPATKGEQ